MGSRVRAVSGPLIPYIKVPEIPLGLPTPFNSIKPFGVLVATGVYLGAIVAVRHARQRGLNLDKMNTFILYVVGLGFVGAHVIDAVFYTPEKLSQDWTYIFQLWAGLSSYGGFFGAIFGTFVYKWVKKEDVMPYMDTVCSAFPLAWVFGRAGCATVHDHPGRITQSWLGVHYPEFIQDPAILKLAKDDRHIGLLYDPTLTVGRFDLGLIEMALTIPLALSFLYLWSRKPRNYGFWAGWQCIFYAPVRFALDFFRIEEGGRHEADPRHFGLTPAQFACFILLGVGVYMLRMSKQFPAPATWAEQEALNKKFMAIEAGEDEDEAPAPKRRKEVARAEADAPRAKRKRAPEPKSEASSEAEPKPEAELEAEPAPKKKKKKRPPSSDD